MNRRKVLLLVAAVIAALGTALVFVYVQGADSRADAQYGAVQVLRATKQISPGETVAAAQAAGKIQISTVARKDLLPDALSGLEPISDKVATAAIYPNEQIVSSKFGATGSSTSLTMPKGKLAISVQLSDPQRVAGFLTPGDKVAIFMSGTESGDGGAQFTRMLISNVQVVATGATTAVSASADPNADPAAAPVEQVPTTLLTVAVTQSEAERVLYADQNGDLAFGLLNNDSQVAASGGVTSANLFR
jgi:pilus assembly protein CpaB